MLRCYGLLAFFMAVTADQGNPHRLLTLDSTNFTWAMRAYPRMLLLFYAPWCGHSRTLEPEVRKAAEILQGTVVVAKIDASLEVEVADEFGIAAYPGLFLLQKGSYEEFSGRRAAASLVDWVRSKVGPPLELMNSTEQLQDALKGRGVHSAAVAKGQLGLKEIMTRLAERNRAWGKFFFLTEGEGRNQVQVFRGLDEVVSAPFEVDIDRQALEPDLYQFLQAEQLPVFGEISQENFYHYETSGADGLLWVIFANNTGLPCWGVQCQQQAQEHASDFRSLAGSLKFFGALHPKSQATSATSTRTESPFSSISPSSKLLKDTEAPASARLPSRSSLKKQKSQTLPDTDASSREPSTPGSTPKSGKMPKAHMLQDGEALRTVEPASPRLLSKTKQKSQAFQDTEALRTASTRCRPGPVGVGFSMFHGPDTIPEEPSEADLTDTEFFARPSRRKHTLQDWVLQTPPTMAPSLMARLTGFQDDGRSSSRNRARANTLPTPRTEEMPKKQLTFVNLSMEELASAIQEEEPVLDWMPEFWDLVLTLPVPPACKTLALRPLAHWVSIYNRWQGMGNWTPGKAPQFFNAFDLQQILCIPMPRVMEFVKLFDPMAYAKANSSKAAQDLERARLPVSPLLGVCILMSSAIAKSQKIRFLLGIFDENDDRCFDEHEFIEMIQALLRGMGAMLGLMTVKDATPSNARTKALAERMFHRIQDYHKRRHEEETEPEVKATPLGSVPCSVVEEWLLGESDDPLNLPLALFVKRFSVGAEDEDPEAFEEESRKFRLSHRAPVDLPLETSASLDARFLNRHEVIVSQRLFKHCLSIGNFDILHEDAETAVGPIDQKLWMEKLHRGLLWMEDSRGFGKTVLSSFFKKLCPKATGRHLRMFHNWVKEYDQLELLRRQAYVARQQLHSFVVYCNRPRLPAEVRRDLLNEPGRLSYFDEEDYLQACTPPEFRPFIGHPLVDAVFTEMLEKHCAHKEEKIRRMQRLYLPTPSPPEMTQEVVKKRVDATTWRRWNEVFDLLDAEDATKEQMVKTRLLPPDSVDFILRVVCEGSGAPTEENLLFSRSRFLDTMLMLSNTRKPREQAD
eukprot:symbB.v1.2.020666.t2/scaffold1753.1/size103005/2